MVSYPYHKVMSFPWQCDKFIITKDLYSFKSPKSHQTYWVWVEGYPDDVYGIKFHLKQHRNSPHKYEILTGFNEPRQVVNTCIKIMEEISKTNPRASFGFVGAGSNLEGEFDTKRYRFYSKMMSNFISNNTYRHFQFPQKSAYLLIPKQVLEQKPEFLSILQQRFKELYPYFE